MKIKSQLLVGGTSVEGDKQLLIEDTPHVVIGTPGRVHDMLRRKYLNSRHINILVIDEADEMLSTGFKEQMYKIFQFMPNDIQIGLFSATMPTDLQELTNKFLRRPIKILVKAEMLTLQGIAQYYINLDDDVQKYETLKATTICFRRSLGKLAPVIINSVLNSSDMIFRLVTLKLRG